MKRLAHVYFRWDGKQYPVYAFDDKKEQAEVCDKFRTGEAKVIVEVCQYGIVADLVFELCEIDGKMTCIQSTIKGGEMAKVRTARRAEKRNGK